MQAEPPCEFKVREDYFDEICGASSVGAQYALCAPAEAATFVGIMTELQDAHLPLRGHRSFTFYKLFFNRRPKLENEHVFNRD